MKRFLKYAAIAAASLAILFVGASALAYWLLDVDGLVRAQIAKAQPEIEKQLGRKVELGSVHTRFFPSLGAELEGITVAKAADAPADEGPLLQIGSAGFDLDLLGAILSLGKEISIDSIWIDGAKAELVRNADGSLSIADILARHPAQPEGEKKDEGMSPDTLALLRKVRIDEIRLGDAEVKLVDRVASTESHIRKLNLRLSDVGLGRTLGVKLSAAAFRDQTNVEWAANVGPIPEDLKIDGLLPLEKVRLQIHGFDLAPLAAYLPGGLRGGVIEADLDVPRFAANAPTEMKGFFAVNGLAFEGGKPTDVRADLDLGADLRSLAADVRKLDLKIGTIALAASGGLRDLGSVPRFENFTVTSSNLDPQVLLALYPAALPEGAKVEGPIALDLKASGTATEQTVKLGVDLAQVDVKIPGKFLKPRGTPFGLTVDGDFTAASAKLRQAGLRLDELDLQLAGTVENFSAPTYDFTIGAKPFSFDRLVRILPAAEEGLRASNAQAAGNGSIQGHLRGKPGQLDADLALALQGLSLVLPDTEVRGDMTGRVFARGNPQGDLQAGLLVDAGQSVIRIPGTLDKAATTPMVLDVVADKKGKAIHFSRFDARLAEARIEATGGLELGGDAALELHLLPLDLEKFAKTVPAIPADKVRNGKLEMTLQVKGDPSRRETLSVVVPKAEMKLGRSDLRGSATVRNLARPEITAEVSSNLFDLDEISPPEPKDGEKAEAKPKPEDNPALKEMSAVASFDLKRARVSGRDLENLRGKVVLRDGVMRVEKASFGVYGGTVRGDGTEAVIWKGQMPFRARLKVENVDVAKLTGAEFGHGNLLSGRGNLDLSLDGEGFDKADLEQSLTGGWSLALQQGRLSGASISRAVLGGLADVPGLAPQKLGDEGDVRELLTSFTVEKGKMKLNKPLALSLDGNRVQLDGAVGIAGDLFLQGTYWVAPKTLELVTGGRCKVTEAAAVPLAITGPAYKPSVKPDAKAVALTLARSCLAGKAEAAVEKLVGTQAADEAKAQVEQAKAQAEQAKAQAQAQADAAKAEADRRAQEAQKAAKKKAEDEAAKIRKKMGF